MIPRTRFWGTSTRCRMMNEQVDCTEIRADVGKLTEEQKEELIQMLANQRCVVVERNPHPVEKLRPCKGIYYYKGEKSEVTGLFHGWASDYEEFCDYGPGNFTVALIELDDGRVLPCRPETIQFLDREGAGK